MAAFGAVAIMLVAGWQFGMGGTETPFSGKEVALENAIVGSGAYGGVCCKDSTACPHPIGLIFGGSI